MVKVINANNKPMKKPQVNLAIPKNHDQRMFKFGYETAINEIEELIDDLERPKNLSGEIMYDWIRVSRLREQIKELKLKDKKE